VGQRPYSVSLQNVVCSKDRIPNFEPNGQWLRQERYSFDLDNREIFLSIDKPAIVYGGACLCESWHRKTRIVIIGASEEDMHTDLI
jgi:hypothetical protein